MKKQWQRPLEEKRRQATFSSTEEGAVLGKDRERKREREVKERATTSVVRVKYGSTPIPGEYRNVTTQQEGQGKSRKKERERGKSDSCRLPI